MNGSVSFRFGPLELMPIAPEEAVEWIVGKAVDETPCLVVTPNINHLRLAEDDARFRDVLRRAELNVADGWPLVLASRLLGAHLPGRVAGIDLVERVLNRGRRLRVAVLGGPPGAAEGLARRISDRHDVALVDPLPPGVWDRPGELERLRARLKAARPNLVLIGLGPPRQELLADALRGVVSGPVICCGAAVEVLAGVRRRAPQLAQKLGLEWAFRLALEPRRLAGRYAVSAAAFLRIAGREGWRRWRRSDLVTSSQASADRS